MNKKQADNALILADLLKKKYVKWDMTELDHCAFGIAEQNAKLFNGFYNDFRSYDTFGSRINDLFFGGDILYGKEFSKITQAKFRAAILKVVDQEGWEEA